MKERLEHISVGDTLPYKDGQLTFTEKSAGIFNNWSSMGKPLPFVYVKLLNENGEEVLVHVKEIDRILEEGE